MRFTKYNFSIHGDYKVQLVSLEEFKDIPFHIKRVYYMYNSGTNMVRGCHAYKHLQQILICLHGSCKIKLDDGSEKRELFLDNPNESICIPSVMWRELFDFSSDAVVLVLASEIYDETYYIRNYDEFLQYVEHADSFL